MSGAYEQTNSTSNQAGETAMPKAYDHLRFNCCYLTDQERFTGCHFIRLRIPIVRWTAFQDVTDIDVIAPHTHSLQNPVEQPSRLTNKGFALLVFLAAWGFADQNQMRIRIADSVNQLMTRGSEPTAQAISQISPNGIECFAQAGTRVDILWQIGVACGRAQVLHTEIGEVLELAAG